MGYKNFLRLSTFAIGEKRLTVVIDTSILNHRIVKSIYIVCATLTL